VIVWQKLGTWSGRGVLQTDPFVSDSGMLRVGWEARGAGDPAAATLRVSVHSAVSGRSLAVAVDHRGPGRDTVYINEDPRAFFLVIESANLEWSVDVDEGIPARLTAPGREPHE
jgi:hypothetical protein